MHKRIDLWVDEEAGESCGWTDCPEPRLFPAENEMRWCDAAVRRPSLSVDMASPNVAAAAVIQLVFLSKL